MFYYTSLRKPMPVGNRLSYLLENVFNSQH